MENMQVKIDYQIQTIDKFICESITKIDFCERGFLSQIILSNLRNFVEHIMLKIFAYPNDIENRYDNICKAIEFVKTRGELKFLRRFHDFLQIVVSHYTLDGENSERLMLKYYEYLIKTKNYLNTHYSLSVLGNLNKFPINLDSNLKEYYDKIAMRIEARNSQRDVMFNDAYYIHKVNPFFSNQKVYYEVTFTSANGSVNKTDRIIAFTDLEISPFYAVKLFIFNDYIEILGKTMPIFIIANWETSIRPCELNNFALIFGVPLRVQRRHHEYCELMNFLTETGFNLVELIDFSDSYYFAVREIIVEKNTSLHFFNVLDRCREISLNCKNGYNVVRYLLSHLNNKIIKKQRGECNKYLSNLYLGNGCIPFDKMPFNTSLINHNPKLSNLFKYINSSERTHELLARLIRNNTEIQGQLYTPIGDVVFDNIEGLIDSYNSNLWSGHSCRRIQTHNNHLYIREYQEDTIYILCKLKELAATGISNYSNSVTSWIQSNIHIIDCEEKRRALIQMFERSKVALIYGSAGTGKSTIINHISHFFTRYSKLYLAQTNPAVDNLKRKVDASNCTFMTINKFLKKRSVTTVYDLLIIDECSTVSNRDMCNILTKASFKVLILVGDIYQIEAIKFGNWFSAARSFIPKTSVFELTIPYRSNNSDLITLWDRVRNMDETILELIARQDYSSTLDSSIFGQAENDEIILCLNYDGLYGINNINRFLQQSNQNVAVHWGIQDYKVNDPVLFNESERFTPLIYNNMKGRIAGIAVLDGDDQIQFDIELDKAINEMDICCSGLTLLDNSPDGNSIIRFHVNRYKTTDEDDDASASDIVPFQVAYAVSIHKAQGLEYNSVKIVITNEVDELITHDIFYTAITRARNKLKIYWTPEVEKKVLNSIKTKDNRKDVALLKLCSPLLG